VTFCLSAPCTSTLTYLLTYLLTAALLLLLLYYYTIIINININININVNSLLKIFQQKCWIKTCSPEKHEIQTSL